MIELAYHFNCGYLLCYYARHHKTNQHFEVANTVHFFLVQHPECSDLIYLILLAAVHSLWIRRRPQPELRIAEVSVSVNIMQAFPDDLLLCEETLVCNQEVQLTLKNKTRYVWPLPGSCSSPDILSGSHRWHVQLCLHWQPQNIIPN